ncbi:MAG TPA: DUF1905 domain-containing protein [Caulobacteraceae bacterium]|nr:DUF1905 domain-containing protein [Caulobacteraceae bacterium]
MGAGEDPLFHTRFETQVIYWRGPSPFFFAPIPRHYAEDLGGVARIVTYGWGMIPVEARIAGVAFNTSLYPKDGTFLLPLKMDIRRKTNITAGDLIVVDLIIHPPAGG